MPGHKAFATGSLLVWLGQVIHIVSAQEVPSMLDPATKASYCATNFSNVNATGYAMLDPGERTDSGPVPPLNLAVTISEGGAPSHDLNSSIWIDFGGANYFNDSALLFDACAIFIDPRQLSPSVLYAAQNDTGNCMATFSQSCLDGLTGMAAKIAQEIAEEPLGSPGNVSTVCGNLVEQLNVYLNSTNPCSNQIDFDEGLIVDQALTSSTDATSSLNQTSCEVANGTHNYWLLQTDGANNMSVYNNGSILWPSQAQFNKSYDQLVTYVWPTLFTFMPLVNVTQQLDVNATFSNASAKMACLRPGHISPGSRVPIPLQAPMDTVSTDSGSGSMGSARHSLSRGAIAGIVIGAVIGFGLLVELANYLYLRRKRRVQRSSSGEPFAEDGMLVPGELLPPGELPANTTTQELDGVARTELDSACLKAEAPGDAVLVELPGSMPEKQG